MRRFAKALVVPAALAMFAVGCETDNGTNDDVMLEEDGTMEDDSMDDDLDGDTDEDF